jgi:hypothetical protein
MLSLVEKRDASPREPYVDNNTRISLLPFP